LKNGPPFEAPIEIKVIGDDLEVLKKLSYQLEDVIRTTPGTMDVDNPFRMGKTDLAVNINRDKAAMAGVSLAEIDNVLRVGVDGLTIDKVSIDQEDYDLVLQTDYREARLDRLQKLYVTNQGGDRVPLSQVAAVNFAPAISEILHFNKDRSIAVTANVVVQDAVTGITEEIIARFDEIDLPDGYELYVAGEYEGQQDSFGDLGSLLIVALIGIFAVLVLQFRSIRQPLIVFAAIPFAITGSFVALYLTGWSFSFFAFVGFNSLIGIVVNNSIILVDYANQLMRKGSSRYEAIVESARTRFMPILLTTTTTILGLVPLTFQATNLWSPLGWTIIGGMISSTFLTLLVVPVLYNWFTPMQKTA
ncbi:MAG: efflux RND transporter permease subunit, partial [Bacteroidota bacterium]